VPIKEKKMTEYQTPQHEPGQQPDPMLRTGKMGGMWMWLIGVVIVGVVIATLFALNPPSTNLAAEHPAPQTSGASTPAGSPRPAVRTTTGAATDGSAPRTIPPAATVR
jgi:hypothetical protein